MSSSTPVPSSVPVVPVEPGPPEHAPVRAVLALAARHRNLIVPVVSLVVLVLIGLGTELDLPLLHAVVSRRGPGGPDVVHLYAMNGFQAA